MSQDTPETPGTPAAPAPAPAPVPPQAPPAATTAAPAPGAPSPYAAAPVPAASYDVADDADVYASTLTIVPTGPGLLARLASEAFGTFFLVLAGLGIALYAGVAGLGGGPLATALGFGVAALAGAIAVGHISGGHFNPAVTLGAAVAGRTSWKDVLPYWLAQLIGGAIGASVLYVVLSSLPALNGTERSFFSAVANGYGKHSPIAAATQAEGFGLLGALLIELVLTAVFVGVILGATDRRSAHTQAPFAIGLTLTIALLVAIPVTNGALNPARATAAAIFSEGWAFKQLWLFWVAPLVGAALAGLVYRAFAAEPPHDDLLSESETLLLEDDLVVTTRTV